MNFEDQTGPIMDLQIITVFWGYWPRLFSPLS